MKVDPDYLDAHRLRIEVLRKLKRYDEVIRSCDALLARGKPSSELYEFRGLAKEKLRDYQGAIEDQTLAIALHPGTAPLLAKRGALYLVSERPARPCATSRGPSGSTPRTPTPTSAGALPSRPWASTARRSPTRRRPWA